MNITTEELNTLNACQSNQDWRKACDAIKAVRNQEYPPDWWKHVKQTGLMDRIMQRWEGSSELEVIYPDNLTDLGHGPVYAMNQSSLKKFKK